MKAISHEQSRRNSARRKRKVKARHRRGRGRDAGPMPVFGEGRVHYEIGARISAMSFGGIVAVRRLVSRLGLAREIDARLKLLRRHLPQNQLALWVSMCYPVRIWRSTLKNGLGRLPASQLAEDLERPVHVDRTRTSASASASLCPASTQALRESGLSSTSRSSGPPPTLPPPHRRCDVDHRLADPIADRPPRHRA